MNRSLAGATGADADPFLPAQALDLAAALGAYTIGSAFVNHLDGVTGSLEPGKLADLVVLDRDALSGTPAEIANTHVLATYVEGEPVYIAPALGRRRSLPELSAADDTMKGWAMSMRTWLPSAAPRSC